MSVSASTLRKLAALSLSPEQMAGVLSIVAEIEEREEERLAAIEAHRAKERARKRRGKSAEAPRNAPGNSAAIPAENPAPPSPKETSPTPPKEITPSPASLRSDSVKARARATRIPEDFEPDLGEALALGLALETAIREAAKFKDHFASAPGQRGVKLDWPATWRNWCRRAAEQQPHSRNEKLGAHDRLYAAAADVLNDLNNPPEIEHGQLRLLGK